MQNVTATRTLNRRLNLLTQHQYASQGEVEKDEEAEEEEQQHVHAVHSQHTDTQTCCSENSTG